jgi:hypothetical protein
MGKAAGGKLEVLLETGAVLFCNKLPKLMRRLTWPNLDDPVTVMWDELQL